MDIRDPSILLLLFFIFFQLENAGGAQLNISALMACIPFKPSLCALSEGDEHSCEPGYSRDCSKDSSAISKSDCCLCPPGRYMDQYNNCERCFTHTDCSNRPVLIEGDHTQDWVCGDWICPTEKGVLSGTSLPLSNTTPGIDTTFPQSSDARTTTISSTATTTEGESTPHSTDDRMVPDITMSLMSSPACGDATTQEDTRWKVAFWVLFAINMAIAFSFLIWKLIEYIRLQQEPPSLSRSRTSNSVEEGLPTGATEDAEYSVSLMDGGRPTTSTQDQQHLLLKWTKKTTGTM